MDQGGQRSGNPRGHIGIRPVGDACGSVDLARFDAPYVERAKLLLGESLETAVDRAASLCDPIDITGRRLFYSNNDISVSLPSGLNLEEILVAIGWPVSSRPFTVIYLGGMEVLEPVWRYVRPKPGVKVFVAVRPGGKGGGKKILMAVAAIAIMVVAFYAAPLIVGALGMAAYTAAGALTTASLVTAAALSSIGTLALGALVKPASVDALSGLNTSSVGGSQVLGSNAGGQGQGQGQAGGEAKSYGLTVNSNQARPYAPVPRVLGRHRVTPNLAAESYTVSEGGVQTAFMLLDFGVGPLFIDDIRIGTTPISEYTSVEFRWHPAFKAGDALSFYSGDHATSRVDSTIEYLVNNVRTTAQTGDFVAVEIQAPQGLIEVDPAGNRIHSVVDVDIYFALEGQPWNPYGYANAEVRYRGDAGIGAAGWAQTRQVGVVNVEASTGRRLRVAIVAGNPVVGESLLAYDGLYYRITAVEILDPDNSSVVGGWWLEWQHAYLTLDGWPNTTSMNDMVSSHGVLSVFNTLPTPAIADNWQVFPRYDIGPQRLQFRGRTQTAQSATINLTMPHQGLWKILVVGRTQAFVGSSSINQLTWTSSRAVRRGASIIPRSPRSLLEVRITATENINGQIGAFSALVTCITKLWDGYDRITRNPAWLVLEILTGPASHKKVPWDQINIDKFYQWSLWCDQLSAQGDIRCTCDMIVDSRTTVGELITLIASCGRATITVVDGKYDVLMEDEPRVPVQLFTERNTNGATINRSWIDQPHALKTSFVDETSWTKKEVYVYNDGFDENNATRFESLDLTGCTRGPQAWRDARYYLAASNLRRETLEFNTDIENIVCARGDMVLFSHDLFYGAETARVQNYQADGTVQVDIRMETTDATRATWRKQTGELVNIKVAILGTDTIYSPSWLETSLGANAPPNAATVGSPGAAPPGWAVSWQAPGTVRSFPAVGLDAGVPFFDLEYVGTRTSGGGSMTPFAAIGPNVAVAAGDIVQFDFQIMFRGGDQLNIQFIMRERDAANAIVSGNNITNHVLQNQEVDADFHTAWIRRTWTVTNPDVIFLDPYLQYTMPLNVPSQVKFRVGAFLIYKLPGSSNHPDRNDLITLGRTDTEVSEWIVDSVAPGSNMSAKIKLMERRPEILLADSGPIPPYVPPGGDGRMQTIAPATALAITYSETFLGGRPVYEATLHWAAPVGVIVSRYDVFDSLDASTRIGTVTQPPFRFTVDRLSLPRPQGETRQYWVEVLTPRGRRSISAKLDQLWTPDRTAPVMLRFAVNVVNTQVMLSWEVQGTPDLNFFQVRHTADLLERNWTKMTIMIGNVAGTASSATLLRKQGVYAIRACDKGFNWSAPIFASVIIDTPEDSETRLVMTNPPAWSNGDFSNTQVVNGRLALVTHALEGWWYADTSLFETEVWRFRVSGDVKALAVNSQEPDDWNAEVWISALGESPLLNDPWFTPLSAAAPIAGVAAGYQPLSSLQITDLDAVLVKWGVRLTRKNTIVEPSVGEASLTLNNETRREFGVDEAIPVAGTSIYFQRKFFRLPMVAIAFDNFDLNAPSGAVTRIVKEVYRDRFFIQGYDKQNNPVGGNIDWTATGYGRQGQ